jgi:hypothetical protein
VIRAESCLARQHELPRCEAYLPPVVIAFVLDTLLPHAENDPHKLNFVSSETDLLLPARS